jgi:hypothetical protein
MFQLQKLYCVKWEKMSEYGFEKNLLCPIWK